MQDSDSAADGGGATMREDVAAMLASAPTDGPKIWELDPSAARELYRGIIAVSERPLAELAVIRDIVVPGPDGNEIPVRVFDPRERRPAGPAVLFFHGGGFVVGDLDITASFVSHLAAELDLPVVAVEYRLAPESPFPAAPADCEAVARWVADGPPELGLEVSSLVLTGESAGGMLAILTSMALRDRPAAVPVLAQAPIVPIVDLGAGPDRFPSLLFEGHTFNPPGRQWCYDLYDAELDDWRATPLSFDQTGMPATLVVTTGFDILRDEGRAYAQALIAAGNRHVVYHEIPDQIHGFYLFSGVAPSCAADVTAVATAMGQMIHAEAARLTDGEGA